MGERMSVLPPSSWTKPGKSLGPAAAVARLVRGFYFPNQDGGADEIWSHFISSRLWREPLHDSE